MLIGSGDTTYTWNDDWAEIPNPGEAKGGWSHHGVVVTEAGHIIASHAARPDLLEFDQDGRLLGAVSTSTDRMPRPYSGKRGRLRVPMDSRYWPQAPQGERRL